MGVVEYRLLVQRIIPLFPVPDGVGIGFEVYRTTRIFPPLQNALHRGLLPAAGVFRLLLRRVPAFPPLVGCGIEYFRLGQHPGDLAGPTALHAQGEDASDHLRRLAVNQPFLFILRVGLVAVGNICCQRLAPFPLGLVHRPDLPAGIFCKKLIEPVFYTCHIIIHAVGVDGVKVVVDGDIPHPILGKGEVDIQPREGRVAAQPRQVFGDAHGYPPIFDLLQHFLKAGAVIVGATVSVVHKKGRVGEPMLFRVLEQYGALVLDGVTLTLVGVLLGEAAVQCCDFISCP